MYACTAAHGQPRVNTLMLRLRDGKVTLAQNMFLQIILCPLRVRISYCGVHTVNCCYSEGYQPACHLTHLPIHMCGKNRQSLLI